MKNNKTKTQESHNKDRKIKAALATSTIVAGLGGGIGIGYAIWYTRNANNNNALPSSLKIIGAAASISGNINSPLSSPRLYCSTDTDIVVSDGQYSFDTLASMPDWLAIDSATGEITGTPPDGSLGEYQIPIKVSSQAYSNLAGNTTIKLTIGDQIPKSLDISGAKNIEGNAQTQIAATDQLSCKTDTGDEVSGVVYEADGLPNGLEIDKETGIISGAPNDEGFGIYTITATVDGLTGWVSKTFKIDSQIVESFTINVPTEPITGNALYELTTDELSCSVNGTVVESGVSYSASSLPKGLSIDKDTGIISGTPTGPTANGTTATITANYTEGGKNLVATAGMVFNISNTLVISSIKLASDLALRDACNLRIDADGVLNQIQNWEEYEVQTKFENYLSGLGNFKTTAILFEGVRSIADGNYEEETGVFQRCRMLENFTTSIRFVEIPSDLNSFYIGDCAFANDTLKFTIDFPSAPPAITIGNYAFEWCEFTDVPFQDSLKTVGKYAFSHCEYMINITLPSSLETIGAYAFAQCNSAATIDFSSCYNLTSIGDCAFAACSSASTIKFSSAMFANENTTAIKSGTFRAMTNLKEIFIPAGAVAQPGGDNNYNAFDASGTNGKIYYYDEGSKTVAEWFKDFFNGLSDWTVEEA